MGKLHNVTSTILSKVREYNLPYYKMVTNLTFYAIIKGGIKLYGRVQRWEYCEKQRYVLSD